MKSVIQCFGLILVLTLLAFGQEGELRVKSTENSGRLRIVTTEKTILTKEQGEWIENSKKLVNSSAYSSDGKLVESTVYFDAGKQTRTFNNDGNIIEEIQYTLNNTAYNRRVYMYGTDGDIIEALFYDAQNNLQQKLSSMKNDRLLTVERYDYSEGEPRYDGKIVYRFDNKKREVEILDYNVNGRIIGKQITVYDGVTGVRERFNYNGTQLNSREKTLFNNKQEIIETYTYDSDGTLLFELTNTPDGERTITEIIHNNVDGSLNMRKVLIYDARKNLLENSAYRSDGSLLNKFVYEYEFDAKGEVRKEKRSTLVPKQGQLVVESIEITDYLETYR